MIDAKKVKGIYKAAMEVASTKTLELELEELEAHILKAASLGCTSVTVHEMSPEAQQRLKEDGYTIRYSNIDHQDVYVISGWI